MKEANIHYGNTRLVGWINQSFVNGADLCTTLQEYLKYSRSGVFVALNCTTALHYPNTGHYYIEYMFPDGVGNVLVRATSYTQNKIYTCQIDTSTWTLNTNWAAIL